ncbi:MAG: Na+/H+ antiporter NhaC family protein, partial [Clostridia bacterium]|nr:Na+/H+ antiporter NhaC family protein [Clostridia bacterium]
MEKKSSRYAYIAMILAIAVLLVILAMSYKDAPIIIEDAETPFAGTFWSMLPPIVAIALALISKEVFSSLFFGCIVGALLYTQFNPWETVLALVGSDYGLLSVLCDGWNMGIIIFLVELGIISDLMNKGGGSEAFGRWAKETVKTRSSAQLITMLLGVLIFVDDYFNCLTVGAVMRPVTESHKISRAKLAYV